MVLRSNSYEGRYLELSVEEVSFDAVNKTHTLSWVLTSTGGISSRYYIADTTVTIAAQQVYFYDAPYWSENTTFPFPITTGSVSGTITVPHAEAVTVSLSTRVYVSTTPETYERMLPLTNLSTGTGTGDAAQITAAENGVLGGTLGVYWTPRSTGKVYTLSYVLSSSGNTVTEKATIHRPTTTAPYRGIIPLDYALAEAIPNGVSRELEIKLTTYQTDSLLDSDILGSDTITVTVTVPEDDKTRPVITGGSCIPSPNLLDGAFIQSKTGVQAVGVTAEGQYGATIVKTYLRCEGENYDGPSRPLSQWDKIEVSLYAMDSRGFLSKPYPVTVTVLPYLNPKLRPVAGKSRVTAQRCDGSGNPDDKGAYLMLSAKRSYSPVVRGGAQRNFCGISYRYRPSQGNWSDWQQILSPESASDEVTTGPLLGTLAEGTSYEVELRALDTLGGESTTLLTLATDRIYWHRDGNLGSLGFGELVTQADTFLIGRDKTLNILGALQLAGDAAQFLLDFAHPVGSILETVSPESPEVTLGGTWIALTGTDDAARWRRTN